MSDRELITTQKASVLLGLSPDYSRTILRGAGVRPAEVVGVNHLWDEDEVRAVAERRNA
jgi:hypothetical protein